MMLELHWLMDLLAVSAKYVSYTAAFSVAAAMGGARRLSQLIWRNDHVIYLKLILWQMAVS